VRFGWKGSARDTAEDVARPAAWPQGCEIIEMTLRLWDLRVPLIISYASAPNANMSAARIGAAPSSCSGAMYCSVPTIDPRDPRIVSGLVMAATSRVREL
jgi:hypothetical protein